MHITKKCCAAWKYHLFPKGSAKKDKLLGMSLSPGTKTEKTPWTSTKSSYKFREESFKISMLMYFPSKQLQSIRIREPWGRREVFLLLQKVHPDKT